MNGAVAQVAGGPSPSSAAQERERIEAVSTDAIRCAPDVSELRAEHLSVHFQGLAAIADVTLTLHRGEVLGLIGPNGAGKTTLVNCLTGFQRPSAGRIALGAHDTKGWPAAKFRQQGIARTFQAGRLFNDLTIAQNVEVTAIGLGVGVRAARRGTALILDWIGLADKADQRAGGLAYTDQRRLGIARALVLPPAFVLLDEPAAGMSDAECEGLTRLITSIPRLFGCGVMLIEHNMQVVMGISQRIHVLDGGRTIAEDVPTEIQRHVSVLAAYLGEG